MTHIPHSGDITIIEYDLTPKAASRKKLAQTGDVSIEGLITENVMAEDVRSETEFKKKKKTRKKSPAKNTDDTNAGIELEKIVYSSEHLTTIADHLAELATEIEHQRLPDTRSPEVTTRCFQLRSCPDHDCVAYQASHARCWYIAGEMCGCRTHLGLPSCFECQVFQAAATEPLARMRETYLYVLGMLRRRNEKLRTMQRESDLLKERINQVRRIQSSEQLSELDEVFFEQRLVDELVKFSRRTDEFETERDKKLFEQHKILTEQLGSAYLQLQSVTSELERSNKQLEDKVTERTDDLRKSNMALREAVKHSQEADRLKSEFIANVSHELRTPLNSIIGFSKLIMAGVDGPITERQGTDLNAIYNSGKHLLEIINSILELSKIEAGRTDLDIKSFTLEPMVDEIIAATQSLLVGRPLKLEKNIESSLPEIEADMTKIRQVIYNLVSNAVKFTEEGAILISAARDGEWIIVRITDTGIGIDKEHIQSIFERFRQVDGSTTRKAGGTGLGLNIAKKFIELHRGQMHVESRPGEGSAFSFKIPIKHTI